MFFEKCSIVSEKHNTVLTFWTQYFFSVTSSVFLCLLAIAVKAERHTKWSTIKQCQQTVYYNLQDKLPMKLMKFQREYLASWNIKQVKGYLKAWQRNETAGGTLPRPFRSMLFGDVWRRTKTHSYHVTRNALAAQGLGTKKGGTESTRRGAGKKRMIFKAKRDCSLYSLHSRAPERL